MYQISLLFFSRSDFSREEKEFLYVSLTNALYDAKRFSTAVDVSGSVDVIDGYTGEIIATYEKGICTYNMFIKL